MAPGLELWVEQVVGFEKETRRCSLPSCLPSFRAAPHQAGCPCSVRDRSSCLRERCCGPWACGLGEVLVRGCLMPRQCA